MTARDGLVWAKLQDKVSGIAWKVLTAHEVDPRVSNGHEFQGINRLRELLGCDDRKAEPFPCTFARFEDDESSGPVESVKSTASWYDSRRYDPNRSAEWRLYYPGEVAFVQERCRAGDVMVLVKLRSEELRVLLIENGSTWQRKAEILFSLDFENTAGRGVQLELISDDRKLSFAAAEIAVEFGLVSPDELIPEDEGVEQVAAWLISESVNKLPAGKIVSLKIREVTLGIDPIGAPDHALVAWMEREEAAFRKWERAKVEHWLARQNERALDVDDLLAFSMSVFQTRKSRAGAALQNHVGAIFDAAGLRYATQAKTEHGEKPDFLFPGAAEYHDRSFPERRLRLLGVKTTAKDRFRQVLHEGHRILNKHLLTLEAGISKNQTDNMRASSLQLIVPESIRSTYTTEQQQWVWTLSEFIQDVRSTQGAAS